MRQTEKLSGIDRKEAVGVWRAIRAGALTYLPVFLLTACTLTAVFSAMTAAPAEKAEPTEGTIAAPTEPPAPTAALTRVEEHRQTGSYTPRMQAPDEDNPCYYSSDNIFYAADYGMPNCTCYAWGRVYEISGEPPELSPYDACTWYDYNAENGIYDYGDTPRQGAVACWAYTDGGSGHVAVVEQVEDDTVLLSNSAYSGEEFYLDTVPADDPSQGRDGWIFQGYIYTDQAREE